MVGRDGELPGSPKCLEVGVTWCSCDLDLATERSMRDVVVDEDGAAAGGGVEGGGERLLVTPWAGVFRSGLPLLLPLAGPEVGD